MADMPELLTIAGQFCDEEVVAEFIGRNEKEQQEWRERVSALDEGLGELPWYKDISEEGWKTISLPGWFETEELRDFCGSLWLRKKFDIPEEMVGKPADLWLGTIVDSDKTYVNGHMVGETAYQYPPRKYKVPEAVLRKKDNVLTIRVLCERGNGRLTPDKIYRLFSEEGSVELTDNENCWEYKIGCSYLPAPEMDFIVRKPQGFTMGCWHRAKSWLSKESCGIRANRMTGILAAMNNCYIALSVPGEKNGTRNCLLFWFSFLLFLLIFRKKTVDGQLSVKHRDRPHTACLW